MKEGSENEGQTPPPGDASDWVRRWLDDSGVGLELKVAESFRRAIGDDRRVEHARYFAGSDIDGQGKVREVDVVVDLPLQSATDSELDQKITLVMECKGGSTPWALFTSSKDKVRGDDRFLRTLHSYALNEDSAGFNAPRPLERLLLDDHPLLAPVGQFGYQLRAASGKRKPGSPPSPERDLAWDAVRQTLAAAKALYREGVGVTYERSPAAVLHVWVPVLVTTAPLVGVSLNDLGEVSVKPLQWLPLMGQLNLNKQVERHGWYTTVAGLWVVNAHSIDDFAAICMRSIKGFRLASLT